LAIVQELFSPAIMDCNENWWTWKLSESRGTQ